MGRLWTFFSAGVSKESLSLCLPVVYSEYTIMWVPDTFFILSDKETWRSWLDLTQNGALCICGEFTSKPSPSLTQRSCQPCQWVNCIDTGAAADSLLCWSRRTRLHLKMWMHFRCRYKKRMMLWLKCESCRPSSQMKLHTETYPSSFHTISMLLRVETGTDLHHTTEGSLTQYLMHSYTPWINVTSTAQNLEKVVKTYKETSQELN